MDPGILLRAKTYPYRIPGRSYLVEADGHRELAGDGDFPDLDGRRPVLACGSNQSPRQLARSLSQPGNTGLSRSGLTAHQTSHMTSLSESVGDV